MDRYSRNLLGCILVAIYLIITGSMCLGLIHIYQNVHDITAAEVQPTVTPSLPPIKPSQPPQKKRPNPTADSSRPQPAPAPDYIF